MKENKYRRPIPARATRNGGMDVYDVLTAFGVTCPALAHAVKKILCPGQRGAKDKLQDLKEAAWSLAEAIQFAEDAAGTSAPHEPATIKISPPKYQKCLVCDGTGHRHTVAGDREACQFCSGTGTQHPHDRS